MVTREFPPISGGIGYYVYNLSKKLLERGHRVNVVTRGSTGVTTLSKIDGINVFRATFFPLYPFHLWIHGRFVNRTVKSLESEVDLVHIHSPLTPPIYTSLPLVTTIHTPSKIDARYHEVIDFWSFAERAQSGLFYPYIEQKIFGLSNLLTSVSCSVSNELEEYGLDSSAVKVVGNGVDEKVFTPISNKSREKYVLFTGVVRARKGLFDFIECGDIVCRELPDVKFIICGDGPFLPQSVEMVKRKGLEKQIVFLGRVSRERLIKTYQNAAVHVVPSHYEGLPTVMLEGMACGLPVVATDVGGSSEVIVHGKNGFLIPPRDPRRMSEVVLKLLADSPLRKKVGKAARATIEKGFSWDKIADNILEFYNRVL